jgi:site-specific DNA-methyltransferase (adenine-specific)
MHDDHKIMLGDCLESLETLDDKSVDIIITSPPYNIGKKYDSYDDSLPRNEYLSWMEKLGWELSRVLAIDGSFFLNIGSTNIDPWLSFDVASRFRGAFILQNHIVWNKSLSIGDETYGHFKPITSKRFINQNHEAIFHFTLTGNVPVDRLAVGVPYMDKSNIKRRGHAQDKRCAGNTWFIPYETVQSNAEKFNHPASFPIGLPMKCIQLAGKSNALVLDPFMGTGTTLVAAYRLGHKSIGMELDPGYAAIAERRLTAEIEKGFSDERGTLDASS